MFQFNPFTGTLDLNAGPGSYADDVLEFDNLAQFPIPGEQGKIYVSRDDNRAYRWPEGGTDHASYREISALESHTHPNLIGATNTQNGTAGFVPAPTANQQGNFLRGNATWTPLSINGQTPDANGDLTISIPQPSTSAPLVNQNPPVIGTSIHYARADHSHPADLLDAVHIVSETDAIADGIYFRNGSVADYPSYKQVKESGQVVYIEPTSDEPPLWSVFTYDEDGTLSELYRSTGTSSFPWQAPSWQIVGALGSFESLTQARLAVAAKKFVGVIKAGQFEQTGPNVILSTVAATGSYADLFGAPSEFLGATSTEPGSLGLVPAPAATENEKFLKGDGTWASVQTLTQVQADWNETDNTQPNFIRNKPAIPNSPEDIGAAPAWTSETFFHNPIIGEVIPGRRRTKWSVIFQTSSDLNLYLPNTTIGVNGVMDGDEIEVQFTSPNNRTVNVYFPSIPGPPPAPVAVPPSAFYSFTGVASILNGVITWKAVNADWNANFGARQILNKPVIPSLSDSSPVALGATANAGISPLASRADHRHPLPAVFGASTQSNSGTSGLVPSPSAGDNARFLRGDGTWSNIPTPNLPTGSQLTYAEVFNSAAGSSLTANLPGSSGLNSSGLGTWVAIVDTPPGSYDLADKSSDVTFDKTTGTLSFLAKAATTVYQFVATIGCNKGESGSNGVDIGISIDGNAPTVQHYTAIPTPGFTTTQREISVSGVFELSPGILHTVRLMARQSGGGNSGSNNSISIRTLNLNINSINALVPATVFGGVTSINGQTPDSGGAITLTIPQPSATAPLSGEISASIGLSGDYARADHRHPLPPTFIGATQSNSGTSGLVPSPSAGDNARFLRGDGTWSETLTQVQADWNETDNTQPDFVRNKPAIPDPSFTITMAIAL